MTGQGIKHIYRELMDEAETVYLLKGAHGFTVSELLQQIGASYSEKGAEIEYFHDPLFEHAVEGVFVQAPHRILFLQATNPSIEPVLPGLRDHVIALYDCVDTTQLSANEDMIMLNESKRTYYEKCFAKLAAAIHIHDDWEIETRKNMNWSGLDRQFAELEKDLFGHTQLQKTGRLTHRLLGTLTPAGARDTVQSITQHLEKRLFIKGYPGTGKSSMMKKLANAAQSRGFDVQLVWCGLDAKSIDMVIIPELAFCIFDSTEPHVYFPDDHRPGDEIFDIAQHCHPTEAEEKNIEDITAKYKASMLEAKHFAAQYAEQERKFREAIDMALDLDEFKKRTAPLFGLI